MPRSEVPGNPHNKQHSAWIVGQVDTRLEQRNR